LILFLEIVLEKEPSNQMDLVLALQDMEVLIALLILVEMGELMLEKNVMVVIVVINADSEALSSLVDQQLDPVMQSSSVLFLVQLVLLIHSSLLPPFVTRVLESVNQMQLVLELPLRVHLVFCWIIKQSAEPVFLFVIWKKDAMESISLVQQIFSNLQLWSVMLQEEVVKRMELVLEMEVSVKIKLLSPVERVVWVKALVPIQQFAMELISLVQLQLQETTMELVMTAIPALSMIDATLESVLEFQIWMFLVVEMEELMQEKNVMVVIAVLDADSWIHQQFVEEWEDLVIWKKNVLEQVQIVQLILSNLLLLFVK
jgi:hypothetical protein